MLSMFKPKFEIVEFDNGKFAVRRKRFLMADLYYSKHELYSWTKPEHIMSFCTVDTLDQAKNILYCVTMSVKKIHNG